MNWLVMKLVFMTIPKQPMPFLVRPIARVLCGTVQTKLIDPNLATALAFIEEHLSRNAWFAGDDISLADFQMGFAVEAALSRAATATEFPHLACLPGSHGGTTRLPASGCPGRAGGHGIAQLGGSPHRPRPLP